MSVEGLSDEISACFCDMCRRAGGGLQMGIEAPAETVTITGPLKTHRSSKLAERAWCDSSSFRRVCSTMTAGRH